MRPTFHPRLINGPFDDPGMLVTLAFDNRALLFDLGDLSPLPPRHLLKVDHAFVSHTHMDHFIGFDRLLRLQLGRGKSLSLYGPEGFLKNVEGKLAGYAWNLVDSFNHSLSIHVHEIRENSRLSRRYSLRRGFAAREAARETPFDGMLVDTPGFTVSAAIIDHGLPCLGFCLTERFHINIIKETLKQMGLKVGPWLAQFKTALAAGVPPDTAVAVPGSPCRFRIGPLAERIARITPGQKIAYIVDAAPTEANFEKIIELSRGADRMFVEAAFLHRDRRLAEEKRHLTARDAGMLAARSGARQLTVFHFSPRYADAPESLPEEAQAVFEGALLPTGQEVV